MSRSTLISQALLLSFFGMAQTMATCNVNTTMIGNMPTTFNNAPESTTRLSGLFLNTNCSSPYSGTVIAWDFCYYISVTERSYITIQAGVWRDIDGNYTLVNDSLINLPIPQPEPGFQFVCRHWTLNKCREPPFDVQEGDIVGMYVNDTSDDNIVHILGMPPGNEPNAGTVKSTSVTDVTDSISKSDLCPVSYSLYLVAVLGNGNETKCLTTTTSSDTPESTTTTTESMDAAPTLHPVAIAVICVLGAVVLALIIIIVAIITKLYHHNRTKGSGPVLITRLYRRNNQANNAASRAKHENTETENGNSKNTDYKLPQPLIRPRQALLPPPLLNVAKSQTPPDQGEATSSSGKTSPPPVVFAIGFDDNQQPNDDQDKITLKPNIRKISHTKAQRIALLPKLDLRRSCSAAEAMNLSHTNANNDIDGLFTSSSEYPYVIHTFEAIEKDRGYVGSLPNMLQFAQNHSSKINLRLDSPCDDNTNTNTDAAPYASVSVDDSHIDFQDDEPSYSYTDRRQLVRNGNNNILCGKDISNQDYHYDEYPSTWTHVAQLAPELSKPVVDLNIYDDCQSPDYQDIDEYQELDEATLTNTISESSLPSSDQVSPLNQFHVKENSNLLLKSKPPIQPRKQLAQIIVSGDQSSMDKTEDSVNLNAQTSDKYYMKLLSSTKNDSHTYTYPMEWTH